jgi:DNA-binding NarL/FixJ family response regulator
MSDRPLHLQLLLIDPDPIFRLGLRVSLETNSQLQVVADVPTDTAALQVLAEIAVPDKNQVNLIVLELGNGSSSESQQLGLQFCRQLKALYPHIPILLLSSVSTPEILIAAKNNGVNGYCPKGISISELVPIMQEIANGGYYWLGITGTNSLSSHLPFARLRNNVRFSGINHINDTLTAVTAQLKIPGLPILDKAILAGQRRELLAARWLVNHLLAAPEERQPISTSQPLPPPISYLSSAISKPEPQQMQTVVPPLLTPKALQSTLFASCINKLQFPLQNLTDISLEIDILREDKKRELLYLILQKVSQQLDELRSSQIDIKQLPELRNKILNHLWELAITDFYDKFSRITVGDVNIEIVTFLLNNAAGVETEILNKIPLVEELFSYLLWQTDLYVDNISYAAGTEPANSQASMILENLLIQIANGVLQPLLNFLADVETIKQNFYDRHLISTREIERFRNNLSWKYRLNNYVNEPQAIFESRYELFVFAPRGIAKISIYSPRNQELAKLSGVRLVVTLLLEFRDAIAPRVQSLLSFLGSGIVFILTQIIGRGLGLVGRGILQGIGSVSLTEKTLKRNSEKNK